MVIFRDIGSNPILVMFTRLKNFYKKQIEKNTINKSLKDLLIKKQLKILTILVIITAGILLVLRYYLLHKLQVSPVTYFMVMQLTLGFLMVLNLYVSTGKFFRGCLEVLSFLPSEEIFIELWLTIILFSAGFFMISALKNSFNRGTTSVNRRFSSGCRNLCNCRLRRGSSPRGTQAQTGYFRSTENENLCVRFLGGFGVFFSSLITIDFALHARRGRSYFADLIHGSPQNNIVRNETTVNQRGLVNNTNLPDCGCPVGPGVPTQENDIV